MTVRYYCVQLVDDEKVISIRADDMCMVRPDRYEFKIDGRVVAQVLDTLRAWWIEERES